MQEMIEEVERIIAAYKSNINGRKKYYDYPFTNNCEHYYQLIFLQRSLDIWTRSLELMRKYSVIRSGVKDLNKSVHFEKLINFNQYEYKLLPNLHKEMIEYMKILEWKLQEK